MKINQILTEAPFDASSGPALRWQKQWMNANPDADRRQALLAAQQMAASQPDLDFLDKKFDPNTAITIDQMMAATEFDNPKDYKGPIGNVAGSEVDATAGAGDIEDPDNVDSGNWGANYVDTQQQDTQDAQSERRTATAGRKDTDAGGDLLATAPNQGGDLDILGSETGLAAATKAADDKILANIRGGDTPQTAGDAGETQVLAKQKADADRAAMAAAMGDVEGGVTTALAKQKSDAGAADKTAAANVDDFSGMAGAEAAAKDRAAAANVDDFSGMTKAQMKASTRNAKAQAAKSGINYAGGDPDVDATATAAAPTKQVAAGTGADGPAGQYATKKVAAGTGADGPANRYAKPKVAAGTGADGPANRYATKQVAAGTGADGPANRYAKPKVTARAADPNALKNKAAFMNKTPPKEGGLLTKRSSNIGKAITSVTKQTGGREGSSFGDGSNPKVGNLLAKGTTMKTDKDLGMTPTPDRGDFNPAAAPKPKADAAKQAAAARNRAANAEREKREMNANR